MLKCIQDSFRYTNKFIILATPLILFSLLSSLYLIFSVKGNMVSLILSLILFIAMLCVFLSGWLKMLTEAVKEPEKEDANTILSLFTQGVGEYFLPTLGMVIITMLITAIVLKLSFLLGMKYIGDIGVDNVTFSRALNSTQSMYQFVNSLSVEQLVKITSWNFLFITSTSVLSLLLMFYSPTMFFKKKNPVMAFFISIKDLFSRKFFKNVLLFILISFSYIIISFLSALGSINIILHFIFTLLNFYYMVYIAILVFNYYYTNYVKIGGTIDETV